MASNNSINFILQATREGLHKSTKQLKEQVTLENVTEMVVLEKKLPLNGVTPTVTEIDFGSITTAHALVINTPKTIALHINGEDAPAIKCSSQMILLNTEVTSLHLDNLTSPSEEVNLEIWLISTA